MLEKQDDMEINSGKDFCPPKTTWAITILINCFILNCKMLDG